MTETTRPIRCAHFRVTSEPCMEPATVEVLGPAPALYCEEHARLRFEEELDERWVQIGVEEYARDCEEAASKLHRWMNEPGVSMALYDILDEARTYLEQYELRRARGQLVAEGGTPRPTEGELNMLEHFRECVRKYGWTEQPPWVTELEAWMVESEATFVLAPTVILRLDDAKGKLAAVTVGKGSQEALLVFRGPEDARGYQRTTGKHTEAEGFELVGMGEEALAALLDKHGLSWVAMPEPWTGDASSEVDLFTREDFFRLLETREPA